METILHSERSDSFSWMNRFRREKVVHEVTKDVVVFLTVPTGKWLHRADTLTDGRHPIAAYGLEEETLLLWSDGSHTMELKGATFPASNWKVFE